MPARDYIHETVKQALINNGWRVTHDPLSLDVDGLKLYVDLGAEKLFAAERGTEKIAVEVKNFTGGSAISDFHSALGQYINYRMVLRDIEPGRQLYLGIPDTLYDEFFQTRLAKNAIQESQLKLIICDLTNQEIVQWIN